LKLLNPDEDRSIVIQQKFCLEEANFAGSPNVLIKKGEKNSKE